MKKPFILIAIIASFVCVFIACSNSHKNASSAAETEIELTPKEPWHGDCQSIARNNEAFGGELATENESTLDESCEPEVRLTIISRTAIAVRYLTLKSF